MTYDRTEKPGTWRRQNNGKLKYVYKNLKKNTKTSHKQKATAQKEKQRISQGENTKPDFTSRRELTIY